MSKRPAFQFYPGEWMKNAKLRRCSPAARGVWMDVLCLFHDSEEEYGLLRWPLKDIANAVGASMTLVRELVAKGVLKGADKDAEAYIYRPKHAGKLGEPVVLAVADGGPLWYSSRMVRDEWVRQRRGEATRFDTANQPTSRSPKVGIGDRHGDGPSSSSSSSPSGNSAPYGAGGPPPEPPPPPPSPRARTAADEADAKLWRELKTLFVERNGARDFKEAGVLLGKLASRYGSDTFKTAGRELLAVVPAPGEPHTYLVSLCEIAAGKRPGLNKQAALEETNQAAAAAFAGA